MCLYFYLKTNPLYIMTLNKQELTTKIVTDIIVVFACIAAVFMYLEYSQEISQQLDVVLTDVLNDFNGSIANTSSAVK